MAAPTITFGTMVKGTGALSPVADAHVANDILGIACFDSNEPATFTTQAGYVEVALSPQVGGTSGGSNAVGLAVFLVRATGAGMTDPVLAGVAGGRGVVPFKVSGCITTGDPYSITAGNTSGPQLPIAIPGAEIPAGIIDSLVLGLVADHINSGVDKTGAFTNASLTGLTKGFFRANAVGNGSGLTYAHGTKATDGVYSAFTATATENMRQARLSIAFMPPGATGATQASDFFCSAWCGAKVGALPSPDHRHIHAAGGTPFVAQRAILLSGSPAWESAPVNDESWQSHFVSGPTGTLRKYLYGKVLPPNDVILVRMSTAAGGFSPELRYRAATQDIVGAVGTALSTPHPILAGRAYVVDVAGDVGSGIRTMKLTVDGEDRGQASRATAANSLTQIMYGAAIETPTTASFLLGLIRIGTQAAAYPFGSTHSFAAQVGADGVHVYDAAGDFKYEDGSNVPLSVTDSWTRMVGLLDGAATRIARGTATVSEYLEWPFAAGAIPATTAIRCAELVSVHRGEDAAANAQTLRHLSGAAVLEPVSAFNFPGVNPFWHAKHMTLDPTGVALTTALMQAWKFRYGYSGTGLGSMAGLMVEVDCTLSTPPGTGTEATLEDPVHVYAGPGTYQVTLRVTDNDGLQSTITKPVIVA